MMTKAYTSFLFGSALLLGTYQTLDATETNNKALKEAPKETPAQEQEEIRKLSQSFGHFIGRNLNTPGIKFNLDLLIKGIREGAEDKPAPMDEAEYEQLLNKHLAKAYLEISNDNLNKANDFMTENGKKSGVIELEKGKLQYQVLEKG